MSLTESNKRLKFGSGKTKHPIKTTRFPFTLARKHNLIKTFVAESDVPLLLSNLQRGGTKESLI